mgnify:CR=1 FL=1
MSIRIINNGFQLLTVEKILGQEDAAGFNSFKTRITILDIGEGVTYIIDGEDYDDAVTMFENTIKSVPKNMQTYNV